jgi:hypothetical protein
MSDENQALTDRVTALEARVAELGVFLQLALAYLSTDPASSLTKSRVVLEKVLLALYRWEMDKNPPRPMVGDMMADKAFIATIPRRIVTRMTAIRDMSNLGPHAEEVDVSDANRVMRDLIEVLEWYVEQHGDLHLQSRQHVEEVAKACKMELSGFLTNEALELYYNIMAGGQDMGYIAKGWEDPGFRIGDLISIPKSRTPKYKTAAAQIRKTCATNGIGITVKRTKDSIEIQMDGVIYADGFNKKTFTQTLETLQECTQKVRNMIE